MRRWIALIGVLVVGILVAGATPASAALTPSPYCNAWRGADQYHMIGVVEYVDDNVAFRRQWLSFRFKLLGGTSDNPRSNITIKVSKLGHFAFVYESPDRLEYGRWYTVVPSHPAYTSLLGPHGERDHRTNHRVEMRPTFDTPGTDPSCVARVHV